MSDATKEKLAQAIPALDAYISAAEKIVDTAFKDSHAAMELLPEFSAAFSTLEERMELLSDDLSKVADETEASGLERVSWSAVLLLSASGVALLLGFIFLYFTNRSVTQVLRSITGQLAELSSQLFRSSDQVSAGAQTLAQGASEQAASLEETAATMEEVSSMAKRNANNAKQANSCCL